MGFFDGGGKAVKFNNVNDQVTGVIVGQYADGREVPYTESQQTDYNTKEPKTYRDGNPVMQAVFQLQTDERVDDDDDGMRTLYVNKTRMKRALQSALKDAKVSDFAVGGTVQVWMTGTERSQGGGQDAKTFAARYYPPTGSLGVSEASAPVAASAPPAPAAAPPAPSAPSAPAPAAPVAAPPAPSAPAPAAPVAAPPAPSAPAPAAPAAPVAPPAPQGSESDLPF